METKTKRKPVAKKQEATVIINDIVQVAPNRNRKDVGTLKQALLRAESIQNPNRVQLYDLYHDVVSIDGKLSGMLDKRTSAVVNKKLHFYDRKKRIVEDMEELIQSNKFGQLISLIVESQYWGVSAVEFIVGKEFDFVEIPRKHLRPERGEITRSQYDYIGTPLTDLPFAWLIGEKTDLGILLQCSMYALYKRSGFGDFAQYVEIFGQPVRVCYYDAYDSRTKDELRRVLEQSGSSLAMMIPSQAKFEMLDGKTSNGSGELQERLIRCCNEEMAIRVLGNTETTTSSASSGYAQAEIHSEQQLEITKADLRFVQNTLNDPHFLAILQSYGLPVENGHFGFEEELNLEHLKQRLELDMQVSSKVPISDDYWYETYGIPKPDNYDELKEQQEAQRQATLDALRQAKNNEEDEDKDKKDKPHKLIAELADFFGVAL